MKLVSDLFECFFVVCAIYFPFYILSIWFFQDLIWFVELFWFVGFFGFVEFIGFVGLFGVDLVGLFWVGFGLKRSF